MQPMQEAAHVLCVPEPLDAALRRLLADEATGAMRHDVRNKLGALRNGAFYVRKRLEAHPSIWDADPRLKRFLELIDADAERIGELMTSQMASTSAIEPRACAVTEVVALVEALNFPAGVEVVRQAPAEVSIAGNAQELQVALFCLLRNAVEALPAQLAGRLRIAARPSGEKEVAIEVEDSGPGLPVDNEKLFEPFFTTRPGRLGLGLKVARRVAQRWGARLELGASELGGAKATLLLRAR